MSRIKTIIFDLNDVVCTFFQADDDGRYEKAVGTTKAQLFRACSRYYIKGDTGEISAEDIITNGLKDLGLPEELKHKTMALFDSDLEMMHGMQRLIEELKKDYRLILLAGDTERFLKLKVSKLGLDRLFDRIYCTCYEGISKYETGIYIRVLEYEDAGPDECLFIDDKPEYIAAAAKAGISGIRFHDPGQLRKELEDRRILNPANMKSSPIM